MTLLEEIQNSAIDASSDLGTLIRKCKLLAARLGSKPLEDWLLWESNGYPEGVKVPDYRVWGLQIKGHFFGPFGSGLRNAPIPIGCLPEHLRHRYEMYECRQSIASIELLLKDEDSRAIFVSTGDLALLLGTDVYESQNCIQTWAEFSKVHLIEVVNAVRNRVLDFSLALWKESPKAGETRADSHDGLTMARMTQIFNTTVYGGSANLVGSASDSAITFNIGAKDLSALEQALRSQGVADPDIQDLSSALKNDPEPVNKEVLGPNVSSWIGKMVQKAADGSWSIGVSVAGKLLAEAITKYYGL